MERIELQSDEELLERVRRGLRKRVGGAAAEFEGEAWLRVSTLVARARDGSASAAELPAAFARELDEAVRAVNREQRRAGSKSGVFGTHLDAQLRDLPFDGRSADEAALDEAALWERALDEATPTMRRNLRWWRERKMRGAAFSAIASEHEEPLAESTVRGGIARAERYLRRVMDELRNQPWEQGPVDYEPVHAAYRAHDVAGLARELAAVAPYARDAQLLNYEGILHLWRDELDLATRALKEALVWADKPGLRCLVANNLGNVEEEAGRFDDALYWFDRARALDARAPTPLLNLLGVVCKRAAARAGQFDLHDRARLLHYIDCLTKLLSSRSLADGDRAYVLRRLRENPDFTPARRHTSWRRIRRWLERSDEKSSPAHEAKKVSP
jgi:tetratricopeptide (TPR) repeat protein